MTHFSEHISTKEQKSNSEDPEEVQMEEGSSKLSKNKDQSNHFESVSNQERMSNEQDQ